MAHDFRGAGHLPNRSPDGQGADPYELPRQRRGRTPQMHGRYPDYDVLEQASHWDSVTREMVLGRVRELPGLLEPDVRRQRRDLGIGDGLDDGGAAGGQRLVPGQADGVG